MQGEGSLSKIPFSLALAFPHLLDWPTASGMGYSLEKPSNSDFRRSPTDCPRVLSFLGSFGLEADFQVEYDF